MFANFIHIIAALLILSFYQPIEKAPLSFAATLLIFFSLTLGFAVYTYIRFRYLAQLARVASRSKLDHRFSTMVKRATILALALFAVDIWGLHLPTFLESIHWLSVVPTLKSLLFLSLFIAHLVLIWGCAYRAHHTIYNTDISRKTYVYSNLAFTVPILIPWALVFGLMDLIGQMPLELPKRALDTPAGQFTYFILFLFSATIFTPVLMQRFWRCRPVADGPVRDRIEALCRRARVQYSDIVHWPIFGGRMITAGVMGLVARFRYIMVTDALLQLLTPDQIDQVIAHEIGHIKHRHLQLYLIFFFGVMLISYTLFPLSAYLIYFSKPVLYLIPALGFDVNTFIYFFYSVVMVAGIVLYFRYLFGYFMRNFERQADTYVFQLFPSAQPLIDTFSKIVVTSGQTADKPNWHHFSIQQRIDFLRRCERSPAWIRHHNRKVRRSILAVLACFCLLGAAASYINQKVFSPENRILKLYEISLAFHPDAPDTLNNLAWLLASEEFPQLHDPQRALQLAQKAIEIKKAPYIWDTLAEALYANGRIEEAIAAEKQALAMDPKERHIYEAQLLKFKQAKDEATPQQP